MPPSVARFLLTVTFAAAGCGFVDGFGTSKFGSGATDADPRVLDDPDADDASETDTFVPFEVNWDKPDAADTTTPRADASADAATAAPDTAIAPDVAPDTATDATSDAKPDAAPDITADTGSNCPIGATMATGACCAAGTVFDATTQACVTPGPLGCFGAVAACKPQWALQWQDAAGKACAPTAAGCSPVGHVCTAADIAGSACCGPGTVPPNCEAAGTGVALPVSAQWQGETMLLPGDVKTLTAIDATVPPLAAFVAASPPTWCPAKADPTQCAGGCSVGSTAGATGTCQPIAGPAWQCPPGFVVSGTTCAPDAELCGSDPFAGIIDAPLTVFVDAASLVKPTGLRVAPFTTVAEAVAALPKGGTIAIAAGSYATAIDTTVPLTIRGRCAAKTTLQGKTGQAVLHAGGGGKLDVLGVRLSGGTEMIRIDGPATAVLAQLDIGGGARCGVNLFGKATASLQSCFIHDIFSTPSDGSLGNGLRADGATLQLTDVRISNARAAGIDAGGGTTINGTGVVIDGTQIEQKSGEGGTGIAVATGAKLSLATVRLTANKNAGALAFGTASSIKLETAWIDSTVASSATAKNGYGALALSGGSLTLTTARLTNNQTGGVRGNSATLNLNGVLIANTQASPAGVGGEGLLCEDDTTAKLLRVQLSGNRSGGWTLSKAGPCSANGLLINGTLAAAKDGTGGVGLAIGGGGSVQLTDCHLTANHFAGLYASGKGNTVSWAGGSVSKTESSAQAGGYGLVVQNGAALTVSKPLRVSGNRAVGVLVRDAGTTAQLGELTIDGTLPREGDNWGGRGLAVENGATVTATSLCSANNRDFGVLVSGADASLSVTTGPVVIDGTLPRADGKTGRGLQVQEGGTAQLPEPLVVGNRDVAVAVEGVGSTLTWSGTLLATGTQARQDGVFGRGVQLASGGQLVGSGAALLRVSGNAESGLCVFGKGSLAQLGKVATLGNGGGGIVVAQGGNAQLGQVTLRGDGGAALACSGTGSMATVDALGIFAPGGHGIDALDGGRALVRRGIIYAASGTAVFASSLGAQVTLVGTRINQTLPDATGSFGHAVQAQDQGLVVLLGSRVVGYREGALVARVGKWAALGCTVAGGQLLAGGALAAGAIVSHFGEATLGAIRIDGAIGAGVLVHQAQVLADGMVVAGTQSGGSYGDAVVASIVNQLKLQRVWLNGSARAGLLVHGNTVTASLGRIDGNGYGVATQLVGKLVSEATLVAANGKDSAADVGMGLPAVPDAMVVPGLAVASEQ